MTKRYVLDTSVLVHDPQSLFSFQENYLYLPLEVIEEIDHLKKGSDEVNINAREVGRRLEKITASCHGGIPKEGIEIGEGGRLFVLIPPEDRGNPEGTLEERTSHYLSRITRTVEGKFGYTDSFIIRAAQELQRSDSDHKDMPIRIVSKDHNLRIRARAVGIDAEDYETDKVRADLNSFFGRNVEIEVPPDQYELINTLHQAERAKTGGIEPPASLVDKLKGNNYAVFRAGTLSALVRYFGGKIQVLPKLENVEGIKPRNYEQRFLLDACLDPNIEVVAGIGKAGTGKTLMALAAGLTQVMEGTKRKSYDRVIVTRPLVETGKELGALPGELAEKLGPYFEPIKTALKVILGSGADGYFQSRGDGKKGKELNHIPGMGDLVEYRPINFIRGDTFHNTYLIIDEAQNFTKKELKLIGTRMGDNSKVVMIGDPFQIDNPFLDDRSNGLVVVTDLFRKTDMPFAYVLLEKGERSPLADYFAEHL